MLMDNGMPSLMLADKQQDKYHAEYFQAEAGDPVLCALAKEEFRISAENLVEAGWEKFTKDKEVF